MFIQNLFGNCMEFGGKFINHQMPTSDWQIIDWLTIKIVENSEFKN